MFYNSWCSSSLTVVDSNTEIEMILANMPNVHTESNQRTYIRKQCGNLECLDWIMWIIYQEKTKQKEHSNKRVIRELIFAKSAEIWKCRLYDVLRIKWRILLSWWFIIIC